LTLRTGKEIASCTLGAAQTISVSLASLDCAASKMTTSAVATSNGILTRRIVSWSLRPGATMSGASYGLLVGVTDAEGISVSPVRLGSWEVR
jgi:hypothetical protein